VLSVSALVATPAPAAARPHPPLLVADVGDLSPDEYLLFAALEGIVNRHEPRIYLTHGRDGQNFEIDQTGERWLRLAVPLRTRHTTPHRLLASFRSRAHGLVVWDPSLPVDTQNIATTIAGLRDLLPASPELAARLRHAPYRLPVVVDLRRLQLRSRGQAYDWALAHLASGRSFPLLAWLGGPRNGRAGQHGLRDVIVARRGFAFEGDPQRDEDIVRRILGAFPAGTPVLGYPFFDEPFYQATGIAPNESFGVGEISQAGKFLIPSSDSTNLTVHSRFAPARERTSWDDHPVAPDAAKTYVAFLISDGDNLGYNQHALLTRHWDDPARGTIPMGVSISPWLAVYAPRIYHYYVRTLAHSDVLVAGPSGAGYAYPQFETDLDGYLAQTARLLHLSGLHAVWILDNGYAASPSPLIVQRYVESLRPAAIFADYGGYVVANPPAVSFADGVPVVHATWGDTVGNAVARIQGSAAAYPGRPAFVLVALSTWGMGYSQAAEVMRQLGPSFEAVRPDRFAGLLKGAQAGGG
jgi:hypothetical protein